MKRETKEYPIFKHVKCLPDKGVIYITKDGRIFFDEKTEFAKDLGEQEGEPIYCG